MNTGKQPFDSGNMPWRIVIGGERYDNICWIFNLRKHSCIILNLKGNPCLIRINIIQAAGIRQNHRFINEQQRYPLFVTPIPGQQGSANRSIRWHCDRQYRICTNRIPQITH